MLNEEKPGNTFQNKDSSIYKIVWSDEAIEAALNCMWSPKTTKGQRLYRENMRLALDQVKDEILEAAARECERNNPDAIMSSYAEYFATKIRKLKNA
jgi:hypothetical protein